MRLKSGKVHWFVIVSPRSDSRYFSWSVLLDFDRKLLEFCQGNEVVTLQERLGVSRTLEAATSGRIWRRMPIDWWSPIYTEEVSYCEEGVEKHDKKQGEEGV